jgi:site-specific DNA-methyltransferase (adenine-specific)
MTAPYWSGDGITLYLGDCRDVLPDLAGVDAVVTDPPYGLEFMGREWDKFKDAPRRVPGTGGREAPFANHAVQLSPQRNRAYQAWCEQWAAECLRVLKPGGYLLAFGGTRTYHRMACAIEDAGFEIRDSLHWFYGSGFPKSKACLKPSHEPVILARKPGRGMVPLNIDACRVDGAGQHGTRGCKKLSGFSGDLQVYEGGNGLNRQKSPENPAGRWPPNVLLTHSADCQPTGTRKVRTGTAIRHRGVKSADTYGEWAKPEGTPDLGYAGPDGTETVEAWDCVHGCPVAELDAQSGMLITGAGNKANIRPTNKTQVIPTKDTGQIWAVDTGGASRFYPTFRYQAKAPRSERPKLPDGTTHPTVKPLTLMRWLVRLVTPPGGLVLDPFCGTGTTLQAAALEGFHAIGIDNDPKSAEMTVRRLDQMILAL